MMTDEKEHLLPNDSLESYSDNTPDDTPEGQHHAFTNLGFTNGESLSSASRILTGAQIENVENENENTQEAPSISSPVEIIDYNRPAADPVVNKDTVEVEVYDTTPPTYTGSAWLSCFFCCVPLSIMAVLHSDRVEKAITADDLVNAQLYSTRTKKLASLAIIYGILLILACIGLYILLAEVSHAHAL